MCKLLHTPLIIQNLAYLHNAALDFMSLDLFDEDVDKRKLHLMIPFLGIV